MWLSGEAAFVIFGGAIVGQRHLYQQGESLTQSYTGFHFGVKFPWRTDFDEVKTNKYFFRCQFIAISPPPFSVT